MRARGSRGCWQRWRERRRLKGGGKGGQREGGGREEEREGERERRGTRPAGGLGGMGGGGGAFRNGSRPHETRFSLVSRSFRPNSTLCPTVNTRVARDADAPNIRAAHRPPGHHIAFEFSRLIL